MGCGRRPVGPDRERRFGHPAVVIRNREPLFAVECKTGDGAVSPAARYFAERTGIPVFYQVHLREDHFQKGKVIVVPFARWCRDMGLPRHPIPRAVRAQWSRGPRQAWVTRRAEASVEELRAIDARPAAQVKRPCLDCAELLYVERGPPPFVPRGPIRAPT